MLSKAEANPVSCSEIPAAECLFNKEGARQEAFFIPKRDEENFADVAQG